MASSHSIHHHGKPLIASLGDPVACSPHGSTSASPELSILPPTLTLATQSSSTSSDIEMRTLQRNSTSPPSTDRATSHCKAPEDASDNDVEREPLLFSLYGDQDGDHVAEIANNEPANISSKGFVTIALLFLVYGMVEFSDTLTELASNEIIEGVLCRMFHGDVDDPVTDARCKDSLVQGEMSRIAGWTSSITAIPNLLTTIFWGFLATKYDGRIILMLSVLGSTLQRTASLVVLRCGFSVYWIWATPLLTVIGGGYNVTSALAFTILSNVVPQSYRANAFLYLSAMPVLFTLIRGPLGYALMQGTGHWTTACTGIVSYVATCMLCVVIPESHSIPPKTIVDQYDCPDELVTCSGLLQKIAYTAKETFASFYSVASQDLTLGLLICSTVFAAFSNSGFVFIMQYMTKQLEMSWAEASFLLTVTDISRLTLFFVVLPVAGALLIRSGHSTFSKDVWICRGSMITYAVASYGIGFVKSIQLFVPLLIMYAYYNGYWSALQSVVTQVAGDDKRAIALIVVGWMDNCGRLVAGPLLAGAYQIGSNKGGYWSGLLFVVTGISMTAVVVAFFLISTKTPRAARSP